MSTRTVRRSGFKVEIPMDTGGTSCGPPDAVFVHRMYTSRAVLGFEGVAGVMGFV